MKTYYALIKVAAQFIQSNRFAVIVTKLPGSSYSIGLSETFEI